MGENQTDRALDPRKELVYKDAYAKEARLRLKWFRRNEDRLIAYAEKPNARVVPREVLDKMVTDRQSRYQNVEKHPHMAIDDAPPPAIDPSAVFNVMKPVDPDMKKLLYEGTQRKVYLKGRCEILPENKYFFPETMGFLYGWNMFYSAPTATPIRYGRCQVIKQSFYCRNGVGRDPDWYQEPEDVNPGICNCK